MSTETIVEFTVKVTKQDKNLYYYAAGVQVGGSKLVTTDIGKDEDGSAITSVQETNPPQKVGGQALGIGQALQMAVEQVYSVLENAGGVK